MDLSTQQRVKIDHLLLQREAAYARVHEIEAKINRLFGEAYPFPAPPVEVAAEAPKKKSTRKPTAKSPVAILRPLNDNEAAYQICFRQEGGEILETHVDRKSVLSLFQSEHGPTHIQRIDTIDTGGGIVDHLWAGNIDDS